MPLPILTQNISHEQDVVTARQQARQLAHELGFDAQDQTRIATAVSEIARNAFRYAGGGKVTYSVDEKKHPQSFVIEVTDQGSGIADVDHVLGGKYRSSTGMGLGLIGTRRLMDDFSVQTSNEGTTVVFSKNFPVNSAPIGRSDLSRITDVLIRQQPKSPLEEVRQQNQELLRTLDELRSRQEELRQLNRELEDTNRGVVALYAELDEKADHLRQADELKSRFLSNMSHEFRTPLNSILALSRILLDHTDGDLTPDQEIQVNFIRKAATDLSELVNDLLDLAKVEAGKTVIHPIEFHVHDLFGALRGMLRPLLLNESINLVFDDTSYLPALYSDEGKISQILRNLISNALKFTSRGEVRISAERSLDGKDILFQVADTGLGIAPEHQETIFQEFTQVDSPTQRGVKGTGLGLPLSRKLAELLGGSLTVESTPGLGSTFTARIPIYYGNIVPADHQPEIELLENEIPILVVEDRPEDILIYERLLKNTNFRVIPAYTIKEANASLARITPKAIILDIVLKGEDGWNFLAQIKHDQNTGTIPVMVVTTVEDQGRAMALGADIFLTKPMDPEQLIPRLQQITRKSEKLALIIDDEEISRYLLRQILKESGFTTIEATNGNEGIRLAVERQPSVIFLDLIMPGITGFEVAKHLKSRIDTAGIPIIISTSKVLSDSERGELVQQASDILSKEIQTREDARTRLEEALHRAGIS